MIQLLGQENNNWVMNQNKELQMSKKVFTTAEGIPVPDNQNSRTSGPRGPILLDDFRSRKICSYPRYNQI